MTDQAIDAALDRREPTEEEQAERRRLAGINYFIEKLKPHMADVLPAAGVTPERIIRLMYADIRRNPRLQQCTQASLLGAILSAVQLGLEPGGPSGECYLAAFKNRGVLEAQFMLGYRGMVKMFWNHPLAKDLDAAVVHEGDEFEYEFGSNKHLTHKPTRPSERGELRCYFAQAHLLTGGAPFVVLYPEEIEAYRHQGASPNGPGWVGNYDTMAKKTCIRQLFTLLPKSVEANRGLARDEGVRTDLTVDGLDAPPEKPEAQPVEEPGEIIDGEVVEPEDEPAEPTA